MEAGERKLLSEEQKEWQGNLHRIWWLKKKGLGLTQKNAAVRCGWNAQGTAGQYINGEIGLNFNAIVQFANVLEVPIDDIAPNSDLTRAMAIAVRNQSEVNPEVMLKGFIGMLLTLNNDDKMDILTQFSDGIGNEARGILLQIIASTVATQLVEA